MQEGYQSLTEKEKETLRLLVRGYDSKTIARHFQLSVHTIHERLRNARQKMSVSSSREAARLLYESEGASGAGTPENLGNTKIGDAPAAADAIINSAPSYGRGWRMSLPIGIGVFVIMSIILSLIVLTVAPSNLAPEAAQSSQTSLATVPSEDTAAVTAARQWLALIDAGDWAGSYAATGQSFKDLNTLEVWIKVASETQPQFGKVQARTVTEIEAKGANTGRRLLSDEFVPAPPLGYQMVKFQTNFTAKPDATETLTLVREADVFKVVGYWID